jgi:hypothetical protein
MDDFRKSFEYEEDKKGAILYFVIMLIIVDIFMLIIFGVRICEFLKQIPPVNIGFVAICILYLLFLLFTAMTCYKLKKNFVTISKKYLAVRTIFMTSCILILGVHNINNKNIIGLGKQYSNTAQFIFWEVIVQLLFMLIFSGGWYLYFLKSKRCKE